MFAFAVEIFFPLCFVTYDMKESTALQACETFPETSCFRPLTSLFASADATPAVCAALVNASYATSGGIGTHAVLPTAFVVVPIAHCACDVAPVVDTMNPIDAAMHDDLPALGW